jgi:hypothetical protein
MDEIIEDQIEDEDGLLKIEISDESLEAAGLGTLGAAYTEFAFCTQVYCPG